jgi:hypothetical protein
MATQRYRVIYHSEVNGKFDAHFGHRQALVGAEDDTSMGASRPNPSLIATALSNHNLHNPKSGAVTLFDSVANLDERAVAVNS